MPAHRPVTERFAEKYCIDPNTGCWNWTASRLLRGGYGQLSLRPGVNVPAHRFSWEQLNGPVPDGMIVRHTCDNPGCVNPDHLELGTHADNMADMAQRGRRLGRSTGSALPPTELRKLRSLLARGATQQDAADALGIHRTTVQRAIYRGDLKSAAPAKPRRVYLDDIARRQVLEKLSAGEPVIRIAAEFGVDRKTIRNIRDRGLGDAP